MYLKNVSKFMKILCATFCLCFVNEKIIFDFGALKCLTFQMRLLIMDHCASVY